MSIHYEHYRIFYYVAKCKSFTQAANALMNSQPNITRAIRNLEQELDCALFTRTNRQVALTPEGEALYRHVSIAFAQLEAGEEELRFGKGLDGGVLRIGATEVALHAILLPVLKEYRTLYPGVHIKLINGSTPDVITHLQKGLADLAVVTEPAAIPETVKRTVVCSVSETAICGSAYAGLACSTLTLEDLTRYPIISLGEQTSTFTFYSRLFSAQNLRFQPDIEAATCDQILPMVKADLGIGFVCRQFLHEEELGRTVFPLRLETPIPPREVSLLMPTDRPSGPAARALEKALIHAARPSGKI